jgi:sulfur carrier protein
VLVNGEPVAVAAVTSVQDLLESRGIARPGVAVAVDDNVVSRTQWARTLLTEGNTVEILTAVQGG